LFPFVQPKTGNLLCCRQIKIALSNPYLFYIIPST